MKMEDNSKKSTIIYFLPDLQPDLFYIPYFH